MMTLVIVFVVFVAVICIVADILLLVMKDDDGY